MTSPAPLPADRRVEALGQAMTAAEYDAGYGSARGRRIGEWKHQLLSDQLKPQPGDHVLDVGCGTGWFTRRFAALPGVHVTGIDLDTDWLEFKRAVGTPQRRISGQMLVHCLLPTAVSIWLFPSLHFASSPTGRRH